ncbi:MAG: ABC transporter permease [Thermonemataceae bacterium]
MMVLSNRVGNLFLNIEGARTQEVIQHLEEVWIDTVPSEPLSFFLLDENFQDHYSAEEKLGELLGYFAGLNILISCLGLWGLASYTTEVRTKEIGIRKVLGASILNIIVLLSKDFLRLVLVASLLAIPLAYYFITNWLKNFAYKTEASWGIFLIAIVIVLLAALLPLTIQAVRVALRDPVKALRAE